MAGRTAYLGNITPQGLVLDLDAAIMGSYPKTGSTWFDISNNGNNGTLYNGPTYNSGDAGVLVFDGNDDTVAVPFSLNTTSSFTVNTFAKCETMTTESVNRQTVFSFNNGITQGFQILSVAIWGESLVTYYGDGTSYTGGTNATNIGANNWHMYTITGDTTNTWSIYIDGILKTTFKPIYTGISVYYRLCSRGPGTSTLNQNWNGKVACTQIYNRALTQFEVWQNFNAYKSRYGIPDIVTNGLVLNLDAGSPYSYLSGSSGTAWTDVSGLSNNGTLISGSSYTSSYINCNGTNGYIQVLDNNSLDFGSGSFTVEYWFRKLTATSNYSNIWGVNKWNTGATTGSNEWSLDIGNSANPSGGNNYSFNVEVGNTSYGTGLSPSQLSLNTWYQLVGQRDGANFKTYLNGVLTMNVTASGFTTSSIVNNVGRNLRINNSNLNNFYTKADNACVRVYNRALSDTEIQQNFNSMRGRFGI